MKNIKTENIYQQYMYSYPHKTAYDSLEGIFFSNYAKEISKKENSLYIHIPFCETKCGYCNLFSVTGQSEELVKEYVKTLKRQSLEYEKYKISVKDLTIGGGTPLILPEKYLEEIFKMVKDNFIWKEDFIQLPKIIETSPLQTTKEKVMILKNYGVSRVSIGVQSFHDGELKKMNRSHNSEMVHKALHILKKAEFSCLNLDLIYGIEGQTKESVLESLKEALSYEPEEMFIYPLYIKKGTKLYYTNKEVASNAYELYNKLKDHLLQNGYNQMSMRRFIKNDYMKKSGILNKEYSSSCGDENVISIGCGGRSYIGNIHYCTPYNTVQKECVNIIHRYIEKRDFDKIEHGYILSEDEVKRRFVIKNLLTVKGLNIENYENKFKSNLLTDFEMIADFMKKEYAYIEKGYLYLTEKGLSLSDYIGPMFISPEVKKRMNQYYGANQLE